MYKILQVDFSAIQMRDPDKNKYREHSLFPYYWSLTYILVKSCLLTVLYKFLPQKAQ